MNTIIKTFKFKKGQEDWRTWSRVLDFVCDYFTCKRKTTYASSKLKTDYEIEVKIIKGRKKK